MKSLEITIKHAVGLHARPAALFVQTAQKYQSKVQVIFNEKTVNAKSLLGLLSLGVTKDAIITIHTDGEDEEDVIQALESLINENFGEQTHYKQSQK